MRRQLADKVVVIIGGTSGLGLSAAKACIAAGARVVAVGLEPSSGMAAVELGDSASVLAGDARDAQTAERAIGRAVEHFGRFDALYHVAGGSGRSHGDGPLHALSDEGWQFTIDLNLSSLMHSNRAAARHFVANQLPGSILNMGSVLGFSPSSRHFTTHAYAAAKSAIIGFTQSCAAYYAGDNIRFNVIAPALVDTPMARRAAGDETIRRFISSKQPLDGGRIGRPEDLDAAAVFLLSDDSRFITGQVLAVDGGWTVSEGQFEEPRAAE